MSWAPGQQYSLGNNSSNAWVPLQAHLHGLCRGHPIYGVPPSCDPALRMLPITFCVGAGGRCKVTQAATVCTLSNPEWGPGCKTSPKRTFACPTCYWYADIGPGTLAHAHMQLAWDGSHGERSPQSPSKHNDCNFPQPKARAWHCSGSARPFQAHLNMKTVHLSVHSRLFPGSISSNSVQAL